MDEACYVMVSTESFDGPPYGRAAQQRAPDREQSIRLHHETSEQVLVASSIQQGDGAGVPRERRRHAARALAT